MTHLDEAIRPHAPPRGEGASNPVPLLDPPETNQMSGRPDPVPPSICPGPHYSERSNAVRVLHRLDHPTLTKAANKIAACCMGAYLAEREDGTLAVVPGVCRQRLCPHCSAARSARIYNQLSRLLEDVDRPRMLTLTLRGADNGLKTQLDRLFNCYRRLRATGLWKSTVVGAIAVVEIKRARDSNQWHPHLHVLFKGGFLPHQKVKEEWLRITGDSFIVHVGGRGGKHEFSRYLAKYASKPADAFSMVDDDVREYALAIRGRRLVITSGCWHGSGIGAAPKQGASNGVQEIITIRALVEGHNLGVITCTETLCLLSTLGRTPRGLVPFDSGLDPPDGPAGLDARRAEVLDAARDAWRDLKAHHFEHQLRALAEAQL